MNEQNTHISWLSSCPASDGNFKTHLKQTYARNIARLIYELPEKGNKAKIATLKAELRKRQYEVNTFKANTEIETSATFHDFYKALEFYNSLDVICKNFGEIINEEFYLIRDTDFQIIVNEILNHPTITENKDKIVETHILSGETIQDCFKQLYTFERSSRYDNFRRYELTNKDLENLYLKWKDTDVTIEMYYGGGTVD